MPRGVVMMAIGLGDFEKLILQIHGPSMALASMTSWHFGAQDGSLVSLGISQVL